MSYKCVMDGCPGTHESKWQVCGGDLTHAGLVRLYCVCADGKECAVHPNAAEVGKALSGLRCLAIWLRSVDLNSQAEDLERNERRLRDAVDGAHELRS